MLPATDEGKQKVPVERNIPSDESVEEESLLADGKSDLKAECHCEGIEVLEVESVGIIGVFFCPDD